QPSGEQVRVLWALQPITITVQGAKTAIDLQGKAINNVKQLNLDDSPLFITGLLTGLPQPSAIDETILTDSVRDFSNQQGEHGWSYGTFADNSTVFIPLSDCTTTDWIQAWGGKYPYVSLTAKDQHPS